MKMIELDMDNVGKSLIMQHDFIEELDMLEGIQHISICVELKEYLLESFKIIISAEELNNIIRKSHYSDKMRDYLIEL